MTDNSQQPQDEADVEQQTFDFVSEEENPLEKPPEHHEPTQEERMQTMKENIASMSSFLDKLGVNESSMQNVQDLMASIDTKMESMESLTSRLEPILEQLKKYQ